jgi:CRISPR/Cas system CSM-associated protein Csm4 (group 5 of RAMP superfamily)
MYRWVGTLRAISMLSFRRLVKLTWTQIRRYFIGIECSPKIWTVENLFWTKENILNSKTSEKNASSEENLIPQNDRNWKKLQFRRIDEFRRLKPAYKTLIKKLKHIFGRISLKNKLFPCTQYFIGESKYVHWRRALLFRYKKTHR